MKIHEYQAKELLGQYGAPVPGGYCVTTPEEAYEAAKNYGKCVIKAQIHSGGRGKGGGVKVANSPEEAKAIAEKMIGMNLVTHQTGPQGKKVRKVLVTEAVAYKHEYYLSVAGDNENARLTIIASREGGTEIEEVAANRPEAIVQTPVSAVLGFKSYEAIDIADRIGLPEALKPQFTKLLASMTRLYLEKDCSLVEINPLVETDDGLLCLDAKVNFDDNAVYRHPDIAALRDKDEEDPKEVRASEYDLSYISLDGSIGCLVNGAGLAMSTMDIIKSFGGQPANFLDVGGSATAEKVAAAFEILLSDENVKAIFINIFGGIMKCDVIAEGVVTAARTIGVKVPIIVRLEGTNVALGKKILAESGMNIISAADMADGARKAVAAAAGR